MKEYIYENLVECADSFQSLLLVDKYITRKMYESFIDRYKDTLELINKGYLDKEDIIYKKIMSILNDGYNVIEKRNKVFVDRKLKDNKEYFDNMFKGIDDGVVLSDEQRIAIITDEDYSLIVAGAGSGKTTTIVAKVKYLIDKCNISPKKIILLAYTEKASLELDERINNDFKLNVEVLTFHKLGLRFLRQLFDKPIQIVDKSTMYNIVSDYIKYHIFPNKEKLKYFINTFKDYVYFKEDVFEYDTFDEYFKHYASQKYNDYKDNIEDYIDTRVNRRLKEYRTINGEYVKSHAEVYIANYLYTNGYDYEYEKVYPYKVDENRSYSPDFTVDIDGLKIYIEYYGLTTLKKDGTFSVGDIRLYHKLIKKKKELHQKYGTDLIELYSNRADGRDYLDVLTEELSKRNIKVHKRSNKMIFYKLLYTFEEVEYYNFIRLITSFIHRFKEKGNTLDNFDELIEKEYDNNVKKQLIFAKDIYNCYEKTIHMNYKVDFNDMINCATKGLEKIKHDDQYLKYDYLIIDEYQDISEQRYDFAKKISDIFNAKIVAVGDDWQAIYGFSGSDVELFSNFYELMGYADILRITNTYRNSQELIDVAGTFISQSKNMLTKTLVSSKHLENPIEIHYYDIDDVDSKTILLKNILEKIYKKNKDSKVLILGRYNKDIDEYLDSSNFKKGINNQITDLDIPKLYIDYLTIHKAKGLGYDEVILINAVNGKYGFPSKIEDEPLLKVLDSTKKELLDYPEERRLFYVALTRTKNRVYIMCPYEPIQSRSEFIREISSNENVTSIIDV